MCLLTVSLNSIHIYVIYWESAIPGAIVQQMGYTLDRLPACRKSCIYDNSKLPRDKFTSLWQLFDI